VPAEARGSAYRTTTGWGVRWFEGDKRRFASGFPSKSKALAHYRDVVRPALARQLPADLDPRRLTLAEFADKYLAAHAIECEAVTISTLRGRLARPLAEFGDATLADLERRVADIAAWRATLPQRSAWHVFGALRQVLDAAVRWDIIQRNPAKLAGSNPQPKREEIDPFTSAELAAVLDELGEWAPMIAFAAHTGLRPGEWIALEWRDVDRAAGVIRVERAYAQPRKGLAGKTMPYPKTGDLSRRSVPLSAAAAVALDTQPRRIDTRLIFPARHGGPLILHNFRARDWRPALDAAGLAANRRVYDLRHTFATTALAAGVSIFELSRIMGTSAAMLDRVYGHLAHGSADAIRAKLDAYGGV
jgi:integrase